MKKQQKEKLKKGLLTALHIIGYICIGLTVLTSIIVGVNSCNPVTQVKAEDTQEEYNYFSFQNYNSYYRLNYTKANSVYLYSNHYYADLDSECLVYGYRIDSYGNLTQANSGLYFVSYGESSTVVEYYVFDYLRINSTALYIHEVNPSREVSLGRFSSNSKTLIVFEDLRYWRCSNSSIYMSSVIFNDALIYVGNTLASQDHGSEYSSLPYNHYKELVNNYWIPGGSTYAQPFVLPYDEIITNGSLYLPIKYNNEYYLDVYYTSDDKDLRLHSLNSSLSGLYKGVTYNFGQVLGYVNNLNYWYYTTLCGCYKFSYTYQCFLSYSYQFEYNNTQLNQLVTTNNLNVNYEIEKLVELHTNPYTYFYNARLVSDGVYYSKLSLGYDYPMGYYANYQGVNGNYKAQNGGYTTTLILEGSYYSCYEIIRYSDYPHLSAKYNNAYVWEGIDNNQSGNASTGGMDSVFDLFTKAFDSVASVLNLQLFGSFTLGSLVFIPLVVVIVLFVIHLFKR